MKHKYISNSLIMIILFLAAHLSGCSSTPIAHDQASDNLANPRLNNSTQLNPSGKDNDTLSESIEYKSDEDELVSVPTATLIPTRKTPDDFDWKKLPIMPELSDNIVAIYQNGIAQGRNPANFSVIGDCQGIPFVFMGPIGTRVLLPRNHEQYLWDAIYRFDESFLRESTTVRGGFTAASILNPMQADSRQCKPGETPLTCEYRLHDPAFIFITLENWRDPDTIDRYESYLRAIIENVIQHGTVPILITKADVSEVKEGIHILNPIIAKLAYEYDVPMVNFWRAAQSLPNRGIDEEREGFHLNQEGYDLKNLLSLQALFNAWQKIETDIAIAQEADNTLAVTVEPISTAGPTTVPIPIVYLLANPDCSGGCIFFGLAQSRDGDVELQGVFAYEYEDKNLVQILPAGFDLQDINPDGKHLLVNHKNFLYAINLEDSSSELISDNLYWLGEQSAYWAGSGPEADVIQIDADTSYQGDTGRAIGLFSSSRSQTVYFESGSCESKGYCAIEGIYQQLPNQAPIQLEKTLRPVFSPDGNWSVFLNPDAGTEFSHGNIRYFILQDPNEGITTRRIIYLPMRPGFRVFPDVRTYAFSPDSDKLFIYYDIYSAYFEKSLSFEIYLLDLERNYLYDFGSMLSSSGSFKPRLVWSPDGQKILLFLTDNESGEEYSLSIYELTFNAGDSLIPTAENIFASENYFYITNIGWQNP